MTISRDDYIQNIILNEEVSFGLPDKPISIVPGSTLLTRMSAFFLLGAGCLLGPTERSRQVQYYLPL